MTTIDEHGKKKAAEEGRGEEEEEEEEEEKGTTINKGEMERRKKTLPQRVSELFQMYDFGSDSATPFFSSPFLRDKMPSMLFADRMNGLLERRDSSQNGTGTSVVRHIPIKILGEEEEEKSEKDGFSPSSPPNIPLASPPLPPSADANHSPAAPTDHDVQFAMNASATPSATTPTPSTFSTASNVSREGQNHSFSSSSPHHPRFGAAPFLSSHSPELRRHFASLFWTPQQSRRISEREKRREEEEGTPPSTGSADAARKLSLGERISTSTPPPLIRRGAPMCGSTITVYTIPITSPSSPSAVSEMLVKTKPDNGWKREDSQGGEGDGRGRPMSPEPYSAIPFKRSSGTAVLSNATSTPSLFVRNFHQARMIDSPISGEKPPQLPPPSKGPPPPFASHFRPLLPASACHPFPTSNYHHVQAVTAAAVPPPPLRRTHTTLVLPEHHHHQQQQQLHQHQLLRRDSEPVIGPLSDSIKMGQEEGHGKKRQDERAMNTRQGVDCTMTSATRTAAPSPLAGDAEERSSLSGSVSCSSSSSATQTRSKSPSLSSLRQSLLRFRPAKKSGAVSPVGSSSSSSAGSSSLLMMPSCVRSRHSSGSEAEGESEAERNTTTNRRVVGGGAAKPTAKGSRGDCRDASPAVTNAPSQSPLVTAALRLTEFVPRNGPVEGAEKRQQMPKKVEEEMDAVEEAIRSLEQFDPSEFVSQQYKTDSTAAMANSNRKTDQYQQKHFGTSPFIRTKVFLARAEPVHLHPSGSANSLPSPLSERRLSLSTLSFGTGATCSSSDQLLLSSSFLPAVPRPSAVSSGSATPTLGSLTSSQQLLPSLVEPMFSQSMDSINRTPRASSPSASFSASQQQPLHQPQNGVRRGVTFNDNTVQHFYTPIDGPPPDYSDSDDAMDGGSLADSEEGDDTTTSTAAVEAEAQLRKRFFCSQLTDCAKVVDINALKMGQFVAAGTGHGGWRQSHILRHNLAAIRDIVYTVEFALGELVESLGRISLDVRDVRQQTHLRQLVSPVRTSLTMLKRIRHALDSTGWSLSTLSRPAGTYSGGQDALDQFVAVLPQLPKDCYKLVQWVYSLSVWRDLPRGGGATLVFLPPSSAAGAIPFQAKFHPSPPPPAPFPPRPSSPSSSLLNYYSSESIEDEQNNNNIDDDEEGSCSSWVASKKHGSSTDRHGWQGKEAGMPNRISDHLANQQQRHTPNGGAESAAALALNDVMDGGESTSSTSSVLTAEERGGAGGDHFRRHSPDKFSSPQGVPLSEGQKQPQQQQKVDDFDGDVVMEEDDLQSVLSEATGNDVQTRLTDFQTSASSLPSSPDQSHQRRVNAELARSLTADQRDLFRLYESQVDSHTSALSRNIEEFFSLIEKQREQKLSFQKVQMIFIEGHSLVGIVRVITRDDAITKHRPLGAFLEHEAARIDALLNECLATAKVAKAKAQTVPAIQAVCSAVVSVSERAHQLKAFWKVCAVDV